eukprot:3586830-Pyramimonas_sp.AAC.1
MSGTFAGPSCLRAALSARRDWRGRLDRLAGTSTVTMGRPQVGKAPPSSNTGRWRFPKENIQLWPVNQD